MDQMTHATPFCTSKPGQMKEGSYAMRKNRSSSSSSESEYNYLLQAHGPRKIRL